MKAGGLQGHPRESGLFPPTLWVVSTQEDQDPPPHSIQKHGSKAHVLCKPESQGHTPQGCGPDQGVQRTG